MVVSGDDDDDDDDDDDLLDFGFWILDLWLAFFLG